MATKELIKKVVRETVGDEALPIVFYLRGKKKTSEFKIAKDLKKEIHEIRSLLYKLLGKNIVRFRRKKDKTKGWYISYWDLNEREIPFIYENLLKEKLTQLRERLVKEENNHFYLCPNGCIRADFEKASDLSFTCPECGEILQPQDNERTIKFIKERIRELEKEVSLLQPRKKTGKEKKQTLKGSTKTKTKAKTKKSMKKSMKKT